MLDGLQERLLTQRRWLWAGILSVFGILSLRCLHQSVDDMYIIFRYVENVVNGRGFVFNIGERVEGYTSFSWVALLAGFVKLGIPVDFAAKALSVLCGGLCLLLAYKIGHQLFQKHPRGDLYAFIPPALLSVNPVFEFWVVGGLATMLYCATVLASILMLLIEERRLREGDRPSARLSALQGAVCALSALTRPEGVVVVAFVGIVKLFLWRPKSHGLTPLLVFGFVAATPIVSHLCWRWFYYDSLLPNTYYAKMIGSCLVRIQKGWNYFLGAMSLNGFGWLGDSGQTAWFGLLIFFGWPVVILILEKGSRSLAILFSGTVLLAFVAVWEGGDWMPYFRFLCPAIALALIGTAYCAVATVKMAWAVSGKLLARIVWILCFGLILVMAADHLRHSVEMKVGAMDEPTNWPSIFSHDILAMDSEDGYGSIALSDIGLVGYRTKYRIIDMVGLVDRHIARSPGPSCQKDYDVAYVMDQKPDFIILNRQFLPDHRVRNHESFVRHYHLLREAGGHELYVRREDDES